MSTLRHYLDRVVITIVTCVAFILQLWIISGAPVAHSLVATVALSIVLVGVLRISGVRERSLRPIVIACLVNIIVLGAHSWTKDERTHLTIKVNGRESQFSSVMDRPQLSAHEDLIWESSYGPPPTSGGIGFISTPDQLDQPLPLYYETNWASRIAEKIDLSRPALGIDNILVTDSDTGAVLLNERFDLLDLSQWRDPNGIWRATENGELATGRRGFIFAGDNSWQNYTVELDLKRQHTTLGIAVLAKDDDPTKAAYLNINVRNGSWHWGQMVSAEQWRGLGPYSWYAKAPMNQAQDWLGLLTLTWEWCILIVVAGAGIALVLAIFTSPISTRLFKPVESSSFGRIPEILFWLTATLLAGGTVYVTSRVGTELLDGIPHVQDSLAYFFQARIFAMGIGVAPAPSYPEPFMHEFIYIQNGKWFAPYPPGWPLILALGFLVNAPWLVNPMLTGSAVALLSFVGRKVGGRAVGILAGGLAATSPFVIQMGADYMSHMASLCMFLVFVWCVMRMLDGHDRFTSSVAVSVCAGLAAGYGIIVRPLTGIVLALPIFVYVALVLWQKPRKWRWLVVAVAAVLVVGITQLVPDGWNAYISANTRQFGLSQFLSAGFSLIYQNTYFLLHHLSGWPYFVALAFVPILFLLGKATRWDWLLLACAVVQMASYAGYFTDGIMYGPRYYFESSAIFILLTARGIIALGRASNELARRVVPKSYSAPGFGYVLVLALVGSLVYLNLTSYMPFQLENLRGYNRVDGRLLRGVQAQHPGNAVVFVENSNFPIGWAQYGNFFSANDPLLRAGTIFVHDLGPQRNVVVSRLFPGRDYYLLKEFKTLVRIDFAPTDLAQAPFVLNPNTPNLETESADLTVPKPPQIDVATPRHSESVSQPTALSTPLYKSFIVVGGPGSAPGLFNDPRSIAIDSTGVVYVADLGNRRIQVFAQDGSFIRSVTGPSETEKFVEPVAVALSSSSDDIYVLDANTTLIFCFDKTGRYLRTLGGKVLGAYSPKGLAVDKNGNVYVADTGFSRVSILSPENILLGRIEPGRGSGPGEIIEPVGLLLDGDDGLYVAEAGNPRVQVFGPDRTVRQQFAIPGFVPTKPVSFARLKDGAVLMSTPERGQLVVINDTGRVVIEIGSFGNAVEEFLVPTGVAVYRDAIWVSDVGKNRLIRLEMR